MADWSNGYVTEVTYTYSYYGEMNPVRIRTLLTLAGYDVPNGAVVCELGFGQGISINIHAAAQADSVFIGTDFSPIQTGFAQKLQQHTGADMLLVDQSFEQFCTREDLPQFDFIVAHGIYSWISEENRQLIDQFVANKLAVGGVFVFSYNAVPGWSSFIPVRDFMRQYADRMLVPSMDIKQKLALAAEAVQQLSAIPAHLSLLEQPFVKARLEKMAYHDPHYLVHEYFNRDWLPMSFPTVAHRMQGLKLDFTASAHISKHLDAYNYTPEQLQAIAQITDPILAEYTKDLFSNTDFRMDMWVKGKQTLPPLMHANRLAKLSFVLVKQSDQIRVSWVTPRGEAEPDASQYQDVLTLLSDYQPRTVEFIQAQAPCLNRSFAQTVDVIKMLLASNVIAPAQRIQDIDKIKERVQQMNRYLIEQSMYDHKLAWLVSPVTGGAISTTRQELLMLYALQLGLNTEALIVDFVQQILVDQSHTCSTEDVSWFIVNRYPYLTALCYLA